MAYGIEDISTIITCPDCLCRLEETKNNDNETRYRHFGENLFMGTDARGCRCTSVGHDFMLIDNNVKAIWSAYRSAHGWTG